MCIVLCDNSQSVVTCVSQLVRERAEGEGEMERGGGGGGEGEERGK